MTDQVFSDSDLGLPSIQTSANQKTQTPPEQQLGNLPERLSDEDLGVASSTKTGYVPAAVSGLENLAIGTAGTPVDIAQAAARSSVDENTSLIVPFTKLKQWFSGTYGTPEGQAELEKINNEISNVKNITSQPLPGGSQSITKAVEPVSEKYLGFGPSYQPQGLGESLVKTGMEVGIPSAAGEGKLLTKAARALGATAGTEAAGDVTQAIGLSPEAQQMAKMAVGVGTGLAAESTGSVAKDIALPQEAAEGVISDIVAKARAEGRAPSNQEIQDALNTEAQSRAQQISKQATAGTPLSQQQADAIFNQPSQMSAYDIAGDYAPKVVSEGTSTNPGATSAQEINDYLTQRTNDTYYRVSNAINNIMGRKVDAAQTIMNMDAAKKIDNDFNYTAAMNDPAASNVGAYPDVQKIYGDPLVRPAVQEAKKPFGLQPSDPFDFSLKFGDEVKQNLDYMVKKAYDDKNYVLYNNLKDRRSQLIDALDNQVPLYSKARNNSSLFFQADNASKAGYNYAKNINIYDAAKAKQAIIGYSPEQLRMFQDGFLSAIKEKAQRSGNSTKIVDNFDTPIMRQKLSDVLGNQKADQFSTMLSSENIYRHNDNIKFADRVNNGLPITWNDVTHMAGAGGAGAAIFNVLHGQPTLGGLAASVGYVTYKGAKAALNLRESRIADQVNKMLASRDPAEISRLSKLAEQNPAAKSVLQKMENLINSQAGTMYGTIVGTNPNGNRQQRASGGKVMDAQTLVRNAERAKNRINKGTEPLLTVPDEAITKALAIANEKI